jgi:hypothetical protein
MTPAWWTRKNLALIAGLVSLVCAASFLSMRPSHTESFPSANAGVEWQCTSFAGILRTCSKAHRTGLIEPVVQSSHKYPLCLRQA